MTQSLAKALRECEFVEVFAEPSFISVSTPGPSTSVLTEPSLLDVRSDTPIQERMSTAELIQLYDETFEEIQDYHNFVNRRLLSWKPTLEFKHFHAMYLHHRATTDEAWQLRLQAQKLLEQAKSLQIHHNQQLTDLHAFIPTITRTDLRKQLYRPSKLVPRSDSPVPATQPSHLRMSDRNVSNPNPAYRRIKCFQCNSPNHIKWYCPEYRCPHCREISPGHAMMKCPARRRLAQTRVDEPDSYGRGYYDIEGSDGNLGSNRSN